MSTIFEALPEAGGMLRVGIPNEDADGVGQGVDYLREVNLTGKAPTGRKVNEYDCR